MNNPSRRDFLFTLPVLAAAPSIAQVHASESPMPQSSQPPNRTIAPNEAPAPQTTPASPGTLGPARAIPLDRQPTRTMANGGESRDIAHGTLATGETVNLHQSMQVVGATPNPPHVIQHSEFIFVREGTLEFQHETDGKMLSETAGPGGVLYVAFGTRHTVKNVGAVPARYFVIAIGGDAK
jgi:mannose-6-phosphate isomerase-like protein (cupin superfamily)